MTTVPDRSVRTPGAPVGRRRPRPRRTGRVLTVAATGLAAAALVPALAACAGDRVAAAPPEGFRLLYHPVAEVAVPEDWAPADPPWITDVDDGAALAHPPGLPTDLELGISLWRFEWRIPDGRLGVPLHDLVAPLRADPGFELIRRHAMEVPGSDEAEVYQASFVSPLLGSRATALFVVARGDGDELVVARLLAPEDRATSEVIAAVLDTFRVTSTPGSR